MKQYKIFPQSTGELYDIVRRGLPSQDSHWTMDETKLLVKNLKLEVAVATVNILNGCEPKKDNIPWKEIANDLISLAETLNDDVGDEYEGLRGRLKVECSLTEEQLDEIGV